jgi:tellurite resistance protein TehA-like permease
MKAIHNNHLSNFTPAWFTIVMGTGVVSSLTSLFHFGANSLALEIITLIFFFLNLLLFTVISGLTVARYWLFPEVSTITLFGTKS